MENPTQKFILTLSCPDRAGIVHAVSGLIKDLGGNIVTSQQFGDPDSGLFFMRVEIEGNGDKQQWREAIAKLADEYRMRWNLDEAGRPLRTVIMVSKEGHCLVDLLYRQKNLGLGIEVVAVVGNHPDLAPTAQFYGVPFLCIPVTKDTKEQAEKQLLDLIRAEKVELVVLARYMQILSDRLCQELHGSVINIHHSFLPSFKGARPYAQAHARGVKLMGATAHYVTADLDEGPIIEQDVTRITHADTVAQMVARGQDVERRVLAQAVQWHTEHRIMLDGNRTVVFP